MTDSELTAAANHDHRHPMQLIEAERKRQIEVEGWSAEHDDRHDDGEMLSAATLYYQHATGGSISYSIAGCPIGWPWDEKWWKPKDSKRDLIRAGALCLAEQERLDRIEPNAFKAHVRHKLKLIIEALRRV
jgi:hypothetical protein